MNKLGMLCIAAIAALAIGCGSGEPCAALETKICKDKSNELCAKAKQALWNQTGPDDKPLSREQVGQFCEMMEGDKDVDAWVTAFQRSVESK